MKPAKSWWVMKDLNLRPSRCKRVLYLLSIAFLRVCSRVFTAFYHKQPKIAQILPPILCLSLPLPTHADSGAVEAAINTAIAAHSMVAGDDGEDDDN